MNKYAKRNKDKSFISNYIQRARISSSAFASCFRQERFVSKVFPFGYNHVVEGNPSKQILSPRHRIPYLLLPPPPQPTIITSHCVAPPLTMKWLSSSVILAMSLSTASPCLAWSSLPSLHIRTVASTSSALNQSTKNDYNVVFRPSSNPGSFDSLKLGTARIHRYADPDSVVDDTEYVSIFDVSAIVLHFDVHVTLLFLTCKTCRMMQ